MVVTSRKSSGRWRRCIVFCHSVAAGCLRKLRLPSCRSRGGFVALLAVILVFGTASSCYRVGLTDVVDHHDEAPTQQAGGTCAANADCQPGLTCTSGTCTATCGDVAAVYTNAANWMDYVQNSGDSGKIWASVLKQAIKRRKPDFRESYYGFRAFGNLLEEAQARGLLEFGRDEKSGAYVYRSSASITGGETVAERPVTNEALAESTVTATEESDGQHATRRKGRGGRKPAEKKAQADLPLSVAGDAATEAAAAKTVREPAVRSRRPRQKEA